MAGNEIREDIVQLVVAAYDAAPDSALMADLEAIVYERGGSLLDVAAALTSGERWEERYPASWTADRFADEWLGSLLPGADAALVAAAREAVVGHLDAGGGFAELVLAAQQYLSGPDAPVQVADAARSFLDRSETAMMLSADQERAGAAAEPREALPLTAGGAGTGGTVTGALTGGGGAMEDYDGDGAADDSKMEAFDAAGRPVRVEYDFNSDGTANHVETYAHAGSITTRLIEADYGGGAGTIVGDGVFDYRERRTILDGVTVRILIDADNDGVWDEVAEIFGFDGRLTYIFGVGGWLESVGLDSDSDGAYEWASTYAFTHHENGEIETLLIAFDGKTAEGLPDGAVDEVWFEGYDVDGVSEFIKFDYDGDGAYDRAEFFTYTWHENGRIETKLTVHDGGIAGDGAIDGQYLDTYDADGSIVSVKQDNDGDGTYETLVTFTYHENGEIETRLRKYDNGLGGGIAGDGVIYGRWLDTYDADGSLVSSKQDNDGDGTYEKFYHTYTYHENGELETQLREHDNGLGGGIAGDGVIDGRWLDTYDADGSIVSSKQDNDGDGTYENLFTYTYHENGRFKTSLIEHDDGSGGGIAGDGAIDGQYLDTYDADGSIVSSKQDNDGDGTYETLVTFTYHENGEIETRLRKYDNGLGGGIAGDGVIDGRWLDTYDADGSLVSSKQDNDGDGTYENLFTYTYHENGELETQLREHDNGLGGGIAGDGVIDGRWLDTYDADGSLVSSKQDNDGDGTYENLFTYTYHENGRFKTSLIERDDGSGGGIADDGVIDGRWLDTYDTDGSLVSSKQDNNGDGIYEEVSTYHENGQIKSWLIERDDGSGGGTAGDGIIDSRSIKTYDANGVIETRSRDFDNDATYDRTHTYTHHENGNLKTELIEYDNGSGGGTDDDGIVDRKTLDIYDAGGVRRSSKYDNDGDGTWDITDTFGWTGTVGHKPDTATRTFIAGIAPTTAVTRAIIFIHGDTGPDTGTAGSGAGWYELGRGDDTITSGGGEDVFVFRYGDGTDVITDFEPRVDTILIREVDFDPADVKLEALILGAGDEDEHPHIPARLFPSDASTVDVAVLTYGGGPGDRIIIVGGNASEDFYRAHFLLHAGHEPDLSGLGG